MTICISYCFVNVSHARMHFIRLDFAVAMRLSSLLESSSTDDQRSMQCNTFFISLSTLLTPLFVCFQLSLNHPKLVHRLAEPLRCRWKSLGRELSPCFTETDLLDIEQTYLLTDGNQECTYQLLREWSIRQPSQATIRSLFTRLKLPVDLLCSLHADVVQTFVV